MKNTTNSKENAEKNVENLKKTIERKHIIEAKTDAAEKLRELFVDSLKDIYWAEKALTKAIPKMAKNASAPKLVDGLTQHLVETEGQIVRLEKVFSLIGEKAVAKKCDAMDGLIEEGKSIMEETEVGAVRDAGIIAAAQKIEHYEIATYGTLAAWAKALGEKDAAALLVESLLEEKNADETLTEAAYHDINEDALEK
ncbi:ferritin-like domain-containing protein [Flavobacterium sp. SM2513]|uniref:YciE/YciF ferroxidase family protein n=1 Tax=Flavobacterium sp. SM2513 TaxID=3424766 RepID=UPI003D7F1D05